MLRVRGATEIFVPCREKYDLCEVASIREMLNKGCPVCEDPLWDGYPEETNAPYGMVKKMLLV